jgi:hypothetical protein
VSLLEILPQLLDALAIRTFCGSVEYRPQIRLTGAVTGFLPWAFGFGWSKRPEVKGVKFSVWMPE